MVTKKGKGAYIVGGLHPLVDHLTLKNSGEEVVADSLNLVESFAMLLDMDLALLGQDGAGGINTNDLNCKHYILFVSIPRNGLSS